MRRLVFGFSMTSGMTASAQHVMSVTSFAASASMSSSEARRAECSRL